VTSGGSLFKTMVATTEPIATTAAPKARRATRAPQPLLGVGRGLALAVGAVVGASVVFVSRVKIAERRETMTPEV